MVFSSTIFLFIFLPCVLAGYYLIKESYRNYFLLIASLLFYAYGEPKFVFVMILSIIANYVFGLLINFLKDSKFKIFGLLGALFVNLGILFYYKYYDFFITNINNLIKSSFPLKHILLPIGISFFTFQGMSYVFDLYLDKVKVQKNILKLALFISLFPQLIAGPIVRYIDINDQIDSRTCTVDKFSEGIKRFIRGLAKKVIIANLFAVSADKAFNTSPLELSVAAAWIGAVSYTIQIYFDFSGYSDMAIGLGKMFGFEFLENFNYPYISKSMTEFWRRWHISLSTWFRDYVYIPLGGNRIGNVYLHLFIVFFATGLWHGASWNFIVWGLWHGMFLIIERIYRLKEISIPIPKVIKWCYTILIVIIGWVFFRAASLTSAVQYIKSMFHLNGNVYIDDLSAVLFSENLRLFMIAVISSTPILIKLRELKNKYLLFEDFHNWFAPIFYIGLFVLGISFTVTSTYNPFIYFNF